MIELKVQKARLNHFKPPQRKPNLPRCTSYVATTWGYFLVTIRSDGVEQWVGLFKSLCLLAS